MSDLSERTLAWFGAKTRDELLAEIDRIITTDKPALAALYERLDATDAALAAEREANQTLRDALEAVRAADYGFHPRTPDGRSLVRIIDAALAAHADTEEPT